MPLSMASLLGLVNRFHVSVDGVDLGNWGRCKGLAVDFKPERIKEGGNYDYQPILAGLVEFPNVTLERAMEAADSAKVQAWLRDRMQSWVHGLDSGHSLVGKVTNLVTSVVPGMGNAEGGTAEITLLDTTLSTPLITWTLRNVYPSKWTGPSLDAMTAGIAMESLELVHEGFL
jgi:phage tail-like protein